MARKSKVDRRMEKFEQELMDLIALNASVSEQMRVRVAQILLDLAVMFVASRLGKEKALEWLSA